MIDAFSWWVELFPTKTTGVSEAAGCIFQHFGRFGTLRNELFSELSRLSQVEHSFVTAYSKEENGLERANREVMRQLCAMLFDARVHDKWSFEQLPMVQRIMNTVEKTSTGRTHTHQLDTTVESDPCSGFSQPYQLSSLIRHNG
jgi:hypothetical protein